MAGLTLPHFNGTLRERWGPFEDRWHVFVRLSAIQESHQLDTLAFCFPLGSASASYFGAIPSGLSVHEALSLMRQRFGSDLRSRSIIQAARNALELRRFRDDRHRSEMVSDLVDSLLLEFDLARITADSERKSYLQRAFNRFMLAERLIWRSLSFDEAVHKVLSWEEQIVHLQSDSSPAVLPTNAPYSSSESLPELDASYRGRFRAPALEVITGSPSRDTADRAPHRSETSEESEPPRSPQFPLPPAFGVRPHTAPRPSTSASPISQAVRRQRSQSLSDIPRLSLSSSQPSFVNRSHTVTVIPSTPERDPFSRSQPARATPLAHPITRPSSTLRRLIPARFQSKDR